MKKLKELLPKGLEGKLIRFVVIAAIIMGVVFQIISHIRVAMIREAVILEEEKQIDLVQEECENSMSEVAQASLLQLITWAADKTDDEFLSMEKNIRILETQVEDVFKNPENYERIKVNPPSKENRGKNTLQILFPDGRENADPGTIEIMEKLANLSPIMEKIVSGKNDYTYDVCIATPDGVMIIMDALSAMKFDENGEVVNYDARTRPWYKGAVETGDVYYTPAIQSELYNFQELCFGVPVYIDGELAAVINGSAWLNELSRMMNERNIGEKGFSILVSNTGQLVSSPKTAGELRMRNNLDEDIRDSVNEGLKNVIDCALSGETGVDVVEVDNELYYVAHAPIETVGWIQLLFVSADEVLAPTQRLLKDMDKSTENMITDLSADFRRSAIWALLILFAFMLFGIMVASLFAKKRVAPILRMSKAVRGFVGEDMAFEMEDIYRTGDEIEELANSFHIMSLKMKDYVNEIVTYTSDRERIETELKAAAQIQAKMLPQVEPDYCNRPGYELYAKMIPAKDVGGDMYDFYYLDDDHLAIMIGDVSGKGITAALFMALGKQVLKFQMMLHGGDVVAAMNEANAKLCEESDDGMFITVWMGVITLSTGVLNFVNGGHLYAAVKRGDKGFVIEEDIHGMLVGALEFVRYSLNTVTLEKGDTLYLYTDGVTEAQAKSDDLFGEKRMLEALNENNKASLKELDDNVRRKATEFVGNSEQYDDMTTLCFKYLGMD